MRRLFCRIPLWVLTYIICGSQAADVRAENAAAGDPTWFSAVKERVARIAQEGRTDLYISGYAWHAPDGYTKTQRAQLNAQAYGGGFGKRSVDEKGHEDMLYAFVFSDSHYDPEPIAGYARQWFTPRPIDASLSFGAGYTIALTARSDTHNYLPFPLILPLATARLSRFSLMGTVILRVPGVTQNRGSIVFLWGRYEL